MTDRFEMLMMRELNFFLGFQIKQVEDETFFSQTKCIRDIIKKFCMEKAKLIKTPIGTNRHLDLNMGGNRWIKRYIIPSYALCFIFVQLGLISCLVFVCVQDFKSHLRNDI
jgi:hypothetical protein